VCYSLYRSFCSTPYSDRNLYRLLRDNRTSRAQVLVSNCRVNFLVILLLIILVLVEFYYVCAHFSPFFACVQRTKHLKNAFGLEPIKLREKGPDSYALQLWRIEAQRVANR
jgi:hypothetical protein